MLRVISFLRCGSLNFFFVAHFHFERVHFFKFFNLFHFTEPRVSKRGRERKDETLAASKLALLYQGGHSLHC